MKIFPLSDPILLPLAPTIARTIADYLQSIAHKFNPNSLQKNWVREVIELQPDLYGHGQFQRSIRQIPTSEYQYVSTIAHQLAAKSALTPLEICQNLDIPISTVDFVERSVHLELDCWYNDASYIYFQLTPQSIEIWLNYIHDLPLEQLSHAIASAPTGSILQGKGCTNDLAIYAHARSCSLLKLAASEKLITVTTDWQIDKSDWLLDPVHRQDRLTTVSNYMFEHPAERQLIQTLMAVLDAIYSDDRQLGCSSPRTFQSSNHPHPKSLSLRERDFESGSLLPEGAVRLWAGFSRTYKRNKIEGLGMRAVNLRKKSGVLPSPTTSSARNRKSPNWARLTIDLAQSWLEFDRRCQTFGEIRQHNPRLAIARCMLTAISRRYLQVLLENYLGVEAAVEL